MKPVLTPHTNVCLVLKVSSNLSPMVWVVLIVDVLLIVHSECMKISKQENVRIVTPTVQHVTVKELMAPMNVFLVLPVKTVMET